MTRDYTDYTDRLVKFDFVPANLWTDDPKAEGYDARASVDKFKSMVAEALQREFPGARIEVREGARYYYAVDGNTTPEKTERVSVTTTEVFNGKEWLVRRP